MRRSFHRFPAVGSLLLFILLCVAIVDVAAVDAATLGNYPDTSSAQRQYDCHP